MNRLTRRLGSAIAIAGCLILLFAIVIGILASSNEVHATQDAPQESASLIRARRATSIPFGIADVYPLAADGESLAASGHAICWEETQMFDLRVTVAQSTTHAFAEGRSVGICAGGERQMWETTATLESDPRFEPGPARACAEAVELAKHGIADTHHWCKDIEITPEE